MRAFTSSHNAAAAVKSSYLYPALLRADKVIE